MKRTTESKRHVVSNWRFLCQQARLCNCRVRAYTVLTALVAVLIGTAQLLWLPLVVALTESRFPLPAMLTGIAAMTVILLCLRFIKHPLEDAFSQSRDAFRTGGSTRLVKKALTMDYPDAVDRDHAVLLSKAAQAMGKHIHAPIPHLWHTLSMIAVNTVMVLIGGGLLLRLSVTVAAVTAGAALVRAVVHRTVSVLGERHRREETQNDVTLSYVSQTARQADMSEDIRVFGLSTWLCQLHDTALAAVRAFIGRRAAIYWVYNAADALLTLLMNGIAYTVLIDMVLHGNLPFSMALLYVFAVTCFSQAVSGLVADLSTLRAERRSLHDYRSYLEQESLFCRENGSRPEVGVPHTLELRDVSFSHPAHGKVVLKHINLTLRAGERLAIVGQDSGGKSVLARLLCGLVDPDEGAVLLDGVDVRTLDRTAYYALFSSVLEDSTLPDMTVADTVAGGNDDVDEERLWQCLEQAGVAQTILQLPGGANTPLGQTAFPNGVKLSGGEAQRLLLARALYKNGDIILLDDPTTALDPLAEQALYQEYARMTAGKSAVFLSRRLASTRFCDRILYLKDGEIVEEGTHDTLMAAGGEYAKLYGLQSRYYREGRNPHDEIG